MADQEIHSEDMIRKYIMYERVIQLAIPNIETHDLCNTHCNDRLILDQECHKRRGKGQANAQVSIEVAKRSPTGHFH